MIKAKFNLHLNEFELDVDLNLPSTGVTVIYGASGSGKSSLLRCFAGLEKATGELLVNNNVWQNHATFLPTHKRQVGYVFQEASLFPHLTVMGNLNYGLKRQKAETNVKTLDSLISLMGIQHLLDRKPDKLSGGEKQRVAIARALAAKPNLLLMDEPMAALDIARKQEILPFITSLRDELDIPVLYVTHSTNELIRLADHMLLMHEGKVIEQGSLNKTMSLLDKQRLPAQTPSVIIEAIISEIDSRWHLAKASFNGGEIWLRDQQFLPQQKVRFMVMDKDVSIALNTTQDTSVSNILPAIVDSIADGDHPAICTIKLKLGETFLLSRLTKKSLHQLNIGVGDHVWAQIKLVAIVE